MDSTLLLPSGDTPLLLDSPKHSLPEMDSAISKLGLSYKRVGQNEEIAYALRGNPSESSGSLNYRNEEELNYTVGVLIKTLKIKFPSNVLAQLTAVELKRGELNLPLDILKVIKEINISNGEVLNRSIHFIFSKDDPGASVRRKAEVLLIDRVSRSNLELVEFKIQDLLGEKCPFLSSKEIDAAFTLKDPTQIGDYVEQLFAVHKDKLENPNASTSPDEKYLPGEWAQLKYFFANQVLEWNNLRSIASTPNSRKSLICVSRFENYGLDPSAHNIALRYALHL